MKSAEHVLEILATANTPPAPLDSILKLFRKAERRAEAIGLGKTGRHGGRPTQRVCAAAAGAPASHPLRETTGVCEFSANLRVSWEGDGCFRFIGGWLMRSGALRKHSAQLGEEIPTDRANLVRSLRRAIARTRKYYGKDISVDGFVAEFSVMNVLLSQGAKQSNRPFTKVDWQPMIPKDREFKSVSVNNGCDIPQSNTMLPSEVVREDKEWHRVCVQRFAMRIGQTGTGFTGCILAKEPRAVAINVEHRVIEKLTARKQENSFPAFFEAPADPRRCPERCPYAAQTPGRSNGRLIAQ